jgi:hypothetical protein
MQIVTSDIGSVLAFLLIRNPDPGRYMYTKKHELYFGIWVSQLRAEFEPGMSLVIDIQLKSGPILI